MRTGSKRSCLRKTACVPKPKRKVRFQKADAYHSNPGQRFDDAARPMEHFRGLSPVQDDPFFLTPLEAVQVAECWHIELAFEDAFDSLHSAHCDNPNIPSPTLPRSCLHDDGEAWRLDMTDVETLPVEEPMPPAWWSSRHIVTCTSHEQDPEQTIVPEHPEQGHEPITSRARPTIWVIPPWRRRLNEALQVFVPSPEDETRKPIVDVWYLDHQHHRRCDQFRSVHLEPQPSIWRRQIVEAWNDMVDRSVGHMIHVCYPAEHPVGHKIADVILVQRSLAHMSSVLVTHHQRSGARRWATVLPNVLHRLAALQALEFEVATIGHTNTLDLRIGVATMRDGIPFPVTQGLHIHVHDRQETDIDDGVVLMQQSFSAHAQAIHNNSDTTHNSKPHPLRTLPTSVVPVEAPTLWLSSRDRPVAKTMANWRTQPTVTLRHANSPDQLPGTRELDDMDGHDMDHDLQEEYYLDTLRRIRRAYDPAYDARLRTWYIQHRHCDQWSQPRTLPYTEDAQTLEDNIFALWRDQLDRTMDEVLFTVVFPDAPGTSDCPQPMADLILSQGIQHPESAVLVAIQDLPGQEITSLCAYSMPHHPTGLEFLHRLQLGDQCATHMCTLWYADELIPLTDAPFVTEDGQAFVVQITPDHDIAVAMQDGSAHRPLQIHDERFVHDAERQFGTTQGVWIHRLHNVPVFHHVRWTDSRTLLLDCARASGLPIHATVAIHHVECQVDGQSDWEHSVIVQSVHDFAPGVSDRLILIDVNMHVGEDIPFPIPPTVIRKVVRVQPMATRGHLLHYTMTAAFCQLQGDRCIVKHNGLLWPQQDIALRHMQHGDYVQIHLPPPSANFHEITLYELMEIDSYGQGAREHVAPGWSLDSTSLLQTSINTYQEGETFDGSLRHLQCQGMACFRKLAHWLHEDAADDATILMQSSAQSTVIEAPDPAPMQMIEDQNFFTQMLHAAWHPVATRVCGEADRHATVQTWFVDFLHVQRCTQPRAVTLYEDFAQWETAIEDAWADMIDRTEPVDIYQVLPAPPDTQPPLCAHVIVCQRAHVHRRAVMVSVYTRGNHLHRSVGLVDAATSEWDLQVVANLGYECTIGALRDRCTCFFGSTAFTPSTMWQTHNGMHFYMLVDAPDLPAADYAQDEDPSSLVQLLLHAPMKQTFPHDSYEDASLMQRLDISHETHDITHCPPFIQELYTMWRQNARSVDGETPTATLQLWFLNFYGDHVCRHPRAIALDDAFTTWDARIAAACGSLLDSTQAYTYYRVHPQPFDRSLSLLAHVLIVQNDDSTRIPVLLTSYDRSDRLSMPQRMAVFVTNPVGGDAVLRQLGHTDCLAPHPPTRCTIWHRNEPLESIYTLVNPIPGDQFFVISQPMHCPEPQTGPRKRPIIALNLLQTRAVLQPADAARFHNRLPLTSSPGPSLDPMTGSRHNDDHWQPPVWTKIRIGRVMFLRNCLLHPLLPTGNQSWQTISWKTCTRTLLENVLIWNGEMPLQLHFYTDGSSLGHDQKAASAVFLMVQTAHGWMFGGFHVFTPLKSMTAQSAEHSAIFGATLWALHIVTQWQCIPMIHFFFDCHAAGHAAAGWWNSWASPVASVTRGLIMWLEEMVGRCHWHHTLAHSDDPGNEAADVIAQQACKDLPMTCEIDSMWNLCTFDDKEPWVSEWLWYLERVLRQPTGHPILDGETLWYNIQPPLSDVPDVKHHPYMHKQRNFL